MASPAQLASNHTATGSSHIQPPQSRPVNNTGLPDNIKTGVERLSGYAMDDVKVHYNSSKPAQLQAHAYAQGTDIHIAPGQEQHVAHEAWHVVQQKQGRVKPTRQMKGKVNINDDHGLETEADVMGAKAISVNVASTPQSPPSFNNNLNAQPIQQSPIIQQYSMGEKAIQTEIKLHSQDSSRGPGITNSTLLVLEVYNQLRIEHDLGDKEIKSEKEGRRLMISKGIFDEEDADYLQTQAGLVHKAKGNRGELLRLQALDKIDRSYDEIDNKYGHHIFQGDTKKGVPTGFHSQADGSTTHEAYGTRTDLGQGVYQQSVRLRGNPEATKPIQSTFFPDDATHEHVIKAIASVYKAGFRTVTHVHDSVNGLELKKTGDTIYPAGGDDNRLAE